jgi:hypothetical protein
LGTSEIKLSQAGVIPSKEAKLHCLLKPVMFWKLPLYKVHTFEFLVVSFIYTCLPPAFRTITYIGVLTIPNFSNLHHRRFETQEETK